MPADITVSIEVELGWGAHDLSTPDDHLSPDRRPETQALRRLLATANEKSLAVTFDVVGHLLLEQCIGEHSGPYPDGWFDADPGLDADRRPHFYAPDLVKYIREADTSHEVCTHTFSHVLFGEMDAPALRDDLNCAVNLHREKGFGTPRTIVPPRHQRPPNALLKDADISVVRVAERSLSPPYGRLRTLQWLLTRRHPVLQPGWNDGILEAPVTPAPSLTSPLLPTGQQSPHPVLKAIPTPVRRRIHSRYLEDALSRAIESDGHLHLWTHLYNLSSEHQLDVVIDFLDTVARERDAGRCRIVRMQDMPETVD